MTRLDIEAPHPFTSKATGKILTLATRYARLLGDFFRQLCWRYALVSRRAISSPTSIRCRLLSWGSEELDQARRKENDDSRAAVESKIGVGLRARPEEAFLGIY
jgi:hypothetical protein